MKYYLVHRNPGRRSTITFASFGGSQDRFARHPAHLPFVDSAEDITRMLFRGLQASRHDATAFKREQIEMVQARGITIWGSPFYNEVFSIVPEDLLCGAD